MMIAIPAPISGVSGSSKIAADNSAVSATPAAPQMP